MAGKLSWQRWLGPLYKDTKKRQGTSSLPCANLPVCGVLAEQTFFSRLAPPFGIVHRGVEIGLHQLGDIHVLGLFQVLGGGFAH